MAKASNQKLKILYLIKIMMEKTDETHSITMTDIIAELEQYGVAAERKSVYSDIESLRQYGLDIIGVKEDRTFYYYVGKRPFELAELKLLVDSVQAAKFITAKKTNELIKKIEGFASMYEAAQLQRQVYVAERIKTMNESIYYNVDKIHAAIAQNRRIRFQYFQWNIYKEMELRKGGAYYEVSPWALSWTDENYYLIAFDNMQHKIKHFRVDKMIRIEITFGIREGRKTFYQFDMAVYAKKMFGMYGGEEQTVKLECENRLAGVMIDRFGKDMILKRTDEQHFIAKVKVAVSRQFLAWVMALGDGVKIVGPDVVVEQVKEEVRRFMRQYDVGSK